MWLFLKDCAENVEQIETFCKQRGKYEAEDANLRSEISLTWHFKAEY